MGRVKSKTMQEDNTGNKISYDRFIKTICEKEMVYGLEFEGGFATSYSGYYEDEEGNLLTVICFWSEEGLAKQCAVQDWSDYKPMEIPLSIFMETLCVDISNQGYLIGTNFNEDMDGYEQDPLDVLLDIVTYLKQLGKKPEFENYNSLSDFEKDVKKALE